MAEKMQAGVVLGGRGGSCVGVVVGFVRRQFGHGYYEQHHLKVCVLYRVCSVNSKVRRDFMVVEVTEYIPN